MNNPTKHGEVLERVMTSEGDYVATKVGNPIRGRVVEVVQ